jgi:hypothetical protein
MTHTSPAKTFIGKNAAITFPRYSKAPEPAKASELDKLFEQIPALKNAKWNDRQLAMIPSLDLANLAYDLSVALQTEFRGRPEFVAYWSSLKKT